MRSLACPEDAAHQLSNSNIAVISALIAVAVAVAGAAAVAFIVAVATPLAHSQFAHRHSSLAAAAFTRLSRLDVAGKWRAASARLHKQCNYP